MGGETWEYIMPALVSRVGGCEVEVKSMPDTRGLIREAGLRLREETIDHRGKLPADERRRLAEEADHRHFQGAGRCSLEYVSLGQTVAESTAGSKPWKRSNSA